MKKWGIVYSILIGFLAWEACKKDNPQDPEPTPTSGFEMTPTTGTAPCAVTFTPVMRTGETYSWTFGDGTASDEPRPVHTFQWPGHYAPLLIEYKNQYPQAATVKGLMIQGPLFEKSGSGPGEKTVKAVAAPLSVSKAFYEDYSNPFSTKQHEARSEFSPYYFAGGYTALGDSSTRKMYFSLLDISGNIVWEKNAGFSGESAVNAVAVLDNQLYAAGYVRDAATGQYKAALVCLDALGNIRWQKLFPASGSQVFNTLQVFQRPQLYYPDDFYSDLMLTGYSVSANGDKDVLAMRVTKAGVVVWQKTFGGALDEEALAVATQYSDVEKWYITGYQQTANAGKDVLLAVVNYYTGAIISQISFGGPMNQVGFAIDHGDGTGLLIAGQTENSGAGGTDVYVATSDLNGQFVKSTSFGSDANEVACVVFGRIEITGNSATFHHYLAGNRIAADGRSTPILIKFAPSTLDKIWEKTFPTGSGARIYNGTSTVDNGFFMVGATGPAPQAYLLRTDGAGNR